MAHKIHMGSQLPSVVGTSKTPGVPYEIYGYMNSVNNFSKVIDPADPAAARFATARPPAPRKPKRSSRSPLGLPAAPATTTSISPPAFPPVRSRTTPADHRRTTPSAPTAISLRGDALRCLHPGRARGAHRHGGFVPQNPNTLLAGFNLAITSVTNTSAGNAPTVNFTLTDDKGNNIALSAAATLSFTMSGPTTDYGAINFGANSTTPGYVTESATAATCAAGGTCSYTFTHVIPATATGTYVMGGRRARP